jgi:hypothetical protein
MGLIINLLTFLAVLIFLGWELFKDIHPQPLKVQNTSELERETFKYSLTLRGDVDLLNLFLEKNWYFSYSDGKVFLLLPDKSSVKEVLKLYTDYLIERKKRRFARFAIEKLIESDIEKTKKKLFLTEKNFRELYNLLKERGMIPSLTVFKEDVKNLQRNIFRSYSEYWDNKYKQILKGFATFVDEPIIDFRSLVKKAQTYYGDKLKVRLFKLYLEKIYYETRLETDLFKYKQYGSSN